jgi:hypothetical protein
MRFSQRNGLVLVEVWGVALDRREAPDRTGLSYKMPVHRGLHVGPTLQLEISGFAVVPRSLCAGNCRS